MGFLTTMLAPSSQPDPTDRFWYGPARRSVSSGVDVDEVTAFNYSAVWAATRLICETLAMLPRVLYEREGETTKKRAVNHGSFRMFQSEPNPEESGFTFFSQETNFALNWGNAYAEMQRDLTGTVVRMWPIHPDRIPYSNIKRNKVSPGVDISGGDAGELVYYINNNDGSATPILKRDMFHMPGPLSENGITGKGVIRQGAESIGMGLATEQYGGSFFGNGAAPSVVLTHPARLGEDAANNLRTSWSQRFSGPSKSNGLLVLEEDMKLERLSVPPNEAQFLETRKFNITEIARWYNLPVHLLREMTKSSFSNIEAENLHYIMISIMPWAVRWEAELNRQVLREEDKGDFFFRFLLQGMLRGDMAARSAFYKELWFMGVYSINDILELEDRNPIGPLGDQRFVQSSMITLENAKDAGKLPPNPPAPAVPAGNDDTEEDMNAFIAGLVNQASSEQLDRIDSLSEQGQRQSSEIIKLSPDNYVTDEQLKITKLDILNEIAGLEMGKPDDTELREREQAMRLAARKMFLGEFERIVRKEAKGARWAAEKPKEFMSRLDEWFGRHEINYDSLIGASIEAVQVLGISCDLDEFATAQIKTTYTELIDISGTATADNLASVVDTVATGWEESKAEQVADSLFSVVTGAG